jgi:ssDNA-binding Zn-finger/Zn-ribbon topoisomerase 1
MINNAVEFVVKNPNRYLNRYDHVLVDEFQDISYQRLQLIKGFVNERSKTKLFCVGDDCQSIFQFTGSDVIFFTNFSEFFAKPEINLLKSNYRCTRRIVEMSNDLISRNKNQIKKVVYSKNKPGHNPLLFEFSVNFNYMEKSHKLKIFSLIEKLLSEGEKSEEIMVISRFNKNLYDVKIHCGANGIPIEEEVEGVVKKKGVRFYSAHKSKGTEAKHVILMGLTSGMYGFPCEIQDSSVFELAQRFEKKNFIEEERRLFYVALTRAKEFLYLFTTQNINSVFLSEIEPFVKKIDINSFEVWNQIISEFIPKYIKGILFKSVVPAFCPECGKPLLKRTGKYGDFLGCTGFPNCRYIFNFIDENTIICPKCSKPMVEEKGPYGKYLKCIGYSECGYKIHYVGENDIPCPSCGGKLVVKVGKYGRFLSCASYPHCNFAYNLERKSKRYIYCPKCRCRLVVRNGKLGKFIGCTNYPNCKFIYEI